MKSRAAIYRKYGAKEFLTDILANLAQLGTTFAVPVYVAWGVMSGNIGGIGVYATLIASSLALKEALNALGWWSSQVALGVAYAQKVQRFFDTDSTIEASTDGEKASDGPFSVRFDHVSYRYGGSDEFAIRDLSLAIAPGEKIAIVGENGAGKTTLIKMIATLLVPTQGEILWDGIPVAKLGEKYRDLLGYLPQQFGYYKNNTPVQYLDYLAALKNMPKQTAKEKIEQLLELVGLSDVADKKMKKFSGGMIQRVGIAQAMLNDPKILILDEPTAGLDPKERARFRNILSTLSKDRIVILSTHIVSDIESNANQVILLKERKLYRMDTVSNICKTLDGKVYECVMEDRAFDAFQDTHLILSVRQEQEHMQVRYYSSKPEEGSRNCTPNLEDVFLVTYQEEPA